MKEKVIQKVIEKLIDIVGREFVSTHKEESFFYSRDGGTMEPCSPDVVVLPKNSEQISKILSLANENKIPVYCMGAGLTLSGLHRAIKGGILIDIKRMDKILEVNEKSRYVVVESGVSQGKLQAYLKKNYPHLKHSMPDAPPAATIGGNIAIHGSGHLSFLGGFHSDMVTGLEVVLANGEIVRTGSCSVSNNWFARAPLPDLSGLFLGWFATTGIITKVGLKLYPAYPFSDVRVLTCEDPDLMSELIYRVTDIHIAEDVMTWMTPRPAWAKDFLNCNVIYGARTKEELIFKRDLLFEQVREFIDKKVAGFLPLLPFMRKRFLDIPGKDLVRFADANKGGGFEYVGAMIPSNLFADAYRIGLEIVKKNRVTYSFGSRIIGNNHCMMFFYAYAFNRADKEDIKKAQKALYETNIKILELGGIPWKAELPAQKEILKRMDKNTKTLLFKIKKLMDPNHIMSPGNWEE